MLDSANGGDVARLRLRREVLITVVSGCVLRKNFTAREMNARISEKEVGIEESVLSLFIRGVLRSLGSIRFIPFKVASPSLGKE